MYKCITVKKEKTLTLNPLCPLLPYINTQRSFVSVALKQNTNGKLLFGFQTGVGMSVNNIYVCMWAGRTHLFSTVFNVVYEMCPKSGSIYYGYWLVSHINNISSL